MNDPRTDAVVAAVEARYPGARTQIALDPHPDSARIPILTILLDADRDRRREAQRFALELARKTFAGEDLPFVVNCVTPETEARYQRDVAEALAQEAAERR